MSPAGGGVLTLAGSNVFAGGVNLNGGTLSLGSTNAIGTTGPISFAGGVLQYTSSNTTDYVSRFNSTPANPVTIDLNTQSVTYNTPYTSAGGSLRVLDSSFFNSGTLILNTANPFTGPTTLSSGTLQINNANSLQNSTATLSGGNLTFGPTVGTFNLGGLAGTGNLTLLDTNSQPVSLVVGGNNSNTSYLGSFSAGNTLTKVGTGNLSLGSSTTVPIHISNGTLSVGLVRNALNISVFNNAPNNADNTQYTTLPKMTAYLGTLRTVVKNALTSPGSLDFSNNGYGGGAPFGSYGALQTDQVDASLTGYINITTPGVYTFKSTSDDGSMVWIDGGDGNTPNNGLPAVNNNFFQGATTRQSTGLFLTAGMHKIDLGFYEGGGGAGVTYTYNGPDTQNSDVTIPTNVLFAPVNNLSFGTVTMASNTTFDVGASTVSILSLSEDVGATGHQVTIGGGTLITGSDNTDTTFSGTISGAGGNLTKVGSGTFTLNGANTHSGTTLISAGNLQINNANGLQNSTVNVNGGALLFGTGVPTFNLGALTGNGTINMANVSSGAVNLVVGGNNASTLFSGNLTGNGSLTKAGTGTLTFSGNYASMQPVSITGGTLRVGSNPSLTVSLYNMNPNDQNNQFNTLAHLQAYLATGTAAVTTLTNDKTGLNYSDFGYGDQAMFGIPGPTTGNYGLTANNNITAYFTGKIKITMAGSYQFRSTSDDGSMVWLDGVDTPVVSNNFYQGATTAPAASLLRPG